MFSSATEAVTHLSYDSEPPTVFELTDDLLDPRTACGAPVRIRINILDATGEVEIECEDA